MVIGQARASRAARQASGALIALALAAPGCSDDAAGDAGGGGSGGAAQSSTGAQGGQGAQGAGGSGGEGGAVSEFAVVSLERDPVVVLGLPAAVTFTARVVHPHGAAAVTAGTLHDGPDSYPFEAADAEGTWTRQVTFQPGPDQPEGIVVFLARFEDQAGAVAERTVGLQFDATGCVGRPDAESCVACFCEQDPTGCAHYQAFQHQHLYCGSTCSGACDAFCATVSAQMTDTTLIDAACDACVPGLDDVGAFEDACTADVPECFSFLVDAYSCGQ